MVGELTIGILALQGAFAKHEEMVQRLGLSTLQVRYPQELLLCNGLIIPGGESTTMTRQIIEGNLTAPLKDFAQKKPVFGTCAGMILMAREGILSLLDITVARNAYGKQKDSFFAEIKPFSFQAPFIRAPRITAIHSNTVQVLAECNGEPVLIQQGRHLAASFHPELTFDTAVHRHFIEQVMVTGGR